MRTFNTCRPLICSLALWAVLTVPARAQSVLKFPRISPSSSARTLLTVTNPTGHFADVQYTFYAMDGPVTTGHPLNPVRYRLPPHGTLSLFSDEIFEADVSGWIQASSSVSGLVGGIANDSPPREEGWTRHQENIAKPPLRGSASATARSLNLTARTGWSLTSNAACERPPRRCE